LGIGRKTDLHNLGVDFLEILFGMEQFQRYILELTIRAAFIHRKKAQFQAQEQCIKAKTLLFMVSF